MIFGLYAKFQAIKKKKVANQIFSTLLSLLPVSKMKRRGGSQTKNVRIHSTQLAARLLGPEFHHESESVGVPSRSEVPLISCGTPPGDRPPALTPTAQNSKMLAAPLFRLKFHPKSESAVYFGIRSSSKELADMDPRQKYHKIYKFVKKLKTLGIRLKRVLQQ